MYYNLDEVSINQFNDYILNIFREYITCKSKNISYWIECQYIKFGNSEMVEKYLIDNHIPYVFYSENNYIKLLFLKQYEYCENSYESSEYIKYQTFKEKFENIFIPNSEINDENKFTSRSAMIDDINIFNNLSDIQYVYFIFDHVQANIVKTVLKDYFNLDLYMYDVDIVNELYDINELCYFEIQQDRFKKSGNYISYDILCELNKANISYCILTDKDGKISIRNEIKLEKDARHYYRTDLKSHFRSSWEANVARIFNYLNIKWEYEKGSFERYKDNKCNGYYFPDFFLGDKVIIEIKGFWNPDSRNKVLEFTKHYTDYKCYLIDKDMYINLKNKYQQFIPEWEEDSVTNIDSETLQIVGLNFGIRKLIVKTLKIGDKVILKRDKNNMFDKNAILAMTETEKEIGFISADWAVIYSQKLDVKMEFNAEIISIEPKVINIKVKRNNPDVETLFDFFK